MQSDSDSVVGGSLTDARSKGKQTRVRRRRSRREALAGHNSVWNVHGTRGRVRNRQRQLNSDIIESNTFDNEAIVGI